MSCNAKKENLRQLFGGAIECEIPSYWVDVSCIRQVPDHQECWHETQDGRLLVIELLEQQDVSAEEAASFFFNDLSEANCSTESIFYETDPVHIPFIASLSSSVANAMFGCGRQVVNSLNLVNIDGSCRESDSHSIWVEICVIRLFQPKTDILISLATPCDSNTLPKSQHTTFFEKVIRSFTVKDWALFG